MVSGRITMQLDLQSKQQEGWLNAQPPAGKQAPSQNAWQVLSIADMNALSCNNTFREDDQMYLRSDGWQIAMRGSTNPWSRGAFL